MDYIRISIRTLKGFRVILQASLRILQRISKRGVVEIQKGSNCFRMGFYRDVFYGISIRIPKGFLWGFYIDFYKGFRGIQRDSKGFPVGKMRWPWPTLPGLDSDELVMSYLRWPWPT